MASGEPFYADPTFWVAGSFVVFVGGLLYKGVHKKIVEGLDEKLDAIRAQIDEAKALRVEAENMVIEYQRKQRDAEQEAALMVTQAKEDAKIMAKAAKADLADLMQRRERSAEEKIAQAEANAIKEVKAAAVNVAVEAATAVLAGAMKGKAGAALVDDAIAEVDKKLH